MSLEQRIDGRISRCRNIANLRTQVYATDSELLKILMAGGGEKL
jgi:hypothetical protein